MLGHCLCPNPQLKGLTEIGWVHKRLLSPCIYYYVYDGNGDCLSSLEILIVRSRIPHWFLLFFSSRVDYHRWTVSHGQAGDLDDGGDGV